MAATTRANVIDVDMHITEDAGTWDSVDPTFSSAPLHICTEAGGRRWLMCGDSRILLLRTTVPGEIDAARNLTRVDPHGYEELIAQRRAAPQLAPQPDPSESDVTARVGVLDAMGVSEAVIFPSLALFWPSVVLEPALADAHYAAWNTWIAVRTMHLRHRLLPIAQYSFHNPPRAVAEIRRCGELGLRGLFVRAVPYRELPWDDESYEEIWDALETSGLPLLLHSAVVGSVNIDLAWEKGLEPKHVGQPIPTFINRARPAEAVLTSLIFGGVLARHPRLRIGVIEFGSIWVPSFLQRLDFTFKFLGPRNRYLRERLTIPPSEYVRRQVKVSTFWNEPLEWLIRSSGDTIFMFSSDFPHPEGNVRAVELAHESIDALPEGTRRRFFSSNARELFDGM